MKQYILPWSVLIIRLLFRTARPYTMPSTFSTRCFSPVTALYSSTFPSPPKTRVFPARIIAYELSIFFLQISPPDSIFSFSSSNWLIFLMSSKISLSMFFISSAAANFRFSLRSHRSSARSLLLFSIPAQSSYSSIYLLRRMADSSVSDLR